MARKLACVLFFGEAESDQKAREIAARYRDCPYVSLIATRKNRIFANYFLPEEQRWWIESVEQRPELLKLVRVRLNPVEHVYYPRELGIRIPAEPLEVSPCGSRCGSCPSYERCLGCPATLFYKRQLEKEKD